MGNQQSINRNKKELSTKIAKLNLNAKNIIKIPVDIITNKHTSNRYHCKFNVFALYAENEIIHNIVDVIIKYINKKYRPINFRIFKITAINSFIQHDVFFDAGLNNIINNKITFYNINNILNYGLQIEIMVSYQYNKLIENINCQYMISNNNNNINPLQCPIYSVMIKNNKYTEEYLTHLNEYNHFKNEYHDKPECKFNGNCASFERLESGGNNLNDLCHIRLYKHPPRGRYIKLSQNVNSLIVNKNNTQNRKIYQPTNFDKNKYNFNDTDGFLYALIEEITLNGYKKDLNQNILDQVDTKMKSRRHKVLGSPLNKGQMLSLILYCGYSCNYDLCASQRNGDYAKWKWFDYLLYKSIFTLSSCETGNFPVYTGLNNVQLSTRQIECGYFVTYVSTSWRKDVAKSFMSGNGMIIKINESYKNVYRVKCCDVSWISKFRNECEILFARHQSDYKYNNSFKCTVIDNYNGVQTVSLSKK